MAITSNPAVQNGAVSTGLGIHSFLNLAEDSFTLVKATAGRICTVNVVVAGSGVGVIWDSATVGGRADANKVAIIPTGVGTYTFDFPCANGILIGTGADQVVSVSFN